MTNKCWPDVWHDLWATVHEQRGDEIDLPKQTLEAFLECAHGGRVPVDLVVEGRRKIVTVNRAKLFELLQLHANEPCGGKS
jgi:hypothetical protein